jgi:endonuclease YncB( thermonuclease family)
MSLLTPDYRYDLIQVVRVIDGDTIELVVGKDVGFNLKPTWKIRIRIEGINCPEMYGATRLAGVSAAQYTSVWLSSEPCIVQTTGLTTFERWVADVYRANGEKLSDALVNSGHAVRSTK